MTKRTLFVLEDNRGVFEALSKVLRLEFDLDVHWQLGGAKAAGVLSRLVKRLDVAALILDFFTRDVFGKAGAEVFINSFPVHYYPTLIWTGELESAVEILVRQHERKAIIVTRQPTRFLDLMHRVPGVITVRYDEFNMGSPLAKGFFLVCDKDETDPVVFKFLRDVLA